MSRLWLMYSGFFAILLLTLLAYWFNVGGLQNELLRNIAYLAAPVFGVLGGLYTLRVYGLRDASGCLYLYLVLGLIFYLVGEVLWVYYDFVLRTTPYPSIADYFYLGAYPAFFVGLLGQVRSSGVNWKKFDPVIVFLFGIIAALLAGVAVYFGVVLAYDSSATPLENTVAIAYGLADCILILCSLLVLILAWEYKGGNFMRLYLFCFFAFVMVMVADIGFAIYNDEYVAGAWWIKNTLDTLWIMQYLYFGLAFFTFGLSLKAVQERLIRMPKK
jgi:hypothetical protein